MAIAAGNVLTIPETGTPYSVPATVSYGLTPEEMQANNAKQKAWLDKFDAERKAALPPLPSSTSGDITSPESWTDWLGRMAGTIASGVLNAGAQVANGVTPNTADIPVIGPAIGGVNSVVSGVGAIFDAATWQHAALYIAGFVFMIALIAFGVFSLTR